MKTLESIQSSMEAKLNEAIRANNRVATSLRHLKEGSAVEKHLPVLRAVSSQVTLCVAEYSAYHNAAYTR